MTTQNLLTIDELKIYVDIADTLEPKYIHGKISDAQYLFLRGLIGEPLYDQLQQEYPDNHSYANITLMQQIKPCIAYRAYQLYLETEGIYSMPMGMREYTEDNSNGVSDARRGMLIKRTVSMAVSYELDVQTFLKNNLDDYPLYSAGCLPKVQKKNQISVVKQNRRRSDLPPLGTGRTLRRNP